MTISVARFTREHEAAAALFNQRMRAANAATAFLLPERASARPPQGDVTMTHYVACDGEGNVRGGMLCQEYPAVIAGKVERVVNISAPLSEGIINSAYMLVGPQLIRHALRQNPRAFVVGMGQSGNPLPRLLKAMGWRIGEVPFYFRVLNGGRCARELRPLRTTRARRIAGTVAAMTGAASLGAHMAHLASAGAKRSARGLRAEPIERWDDRADAAWSAFAGALSFGVTRTSGVLPAFYPFDAHGPRAWVLRRDDNALGWLGMQITQMSANPYFGDLKVAVVTDCVGTEDAVRAGALKAIEAAGECGADIVITNQQHRLLKESCLEAGWRRGPSNFLLATSPALGTVCHGDLAYVTRRDGDGLANLVH